MLRNIVKMGKQRNKVSCKATSILLLDKTIPVKPPIVKRKIKPKSKQHRSSKGKCPLPQTVANQLKILIPVGTAIIIVAEVK